MIVIGDQIESGQIVAFSDAAVTRTTELGSGQYLITTTGDVFYAQGNASVDVGAAIAGSGFVGRGGALILAVQNSAKAFFGFRAETGGSGSAYVQKLAKAVL